VLPYLEQRSLLGGRKEVDAQRQPIKSTCASQQENNYKVDGSSEQNKYNDAKLTSTLTKFQAKFILPCLLGTTHSISSFWNDSYVCM
jgi:hypothetical protein